MYIGRTHDDGVAIAKNGELTHLDGSPFFSGISISGGRVNEGVVILPPWKPEFGTRLNGGVDQSYWCLR